MHYLLACLLSSTLHADPAPNHPIRAVQPVFDQAVDLVLTDQAHRLEPLLSDVPRSLIETVSLQPLAPDILTAADEVAVAVKAWPLAPFKYISGDRPIQSVLRFDRRLLARARLTLSERQLTGLIIMQALSLRRSR